MVQPITLWCNPTLERVRVQRWDRSHWLENLSGYETNCAMIGVDDWQFTRVRAKESETGKRLTAVYGSAPNHGSTDAALNRILENFKQVHLAASSVPRRPVPSS